MSAEGNSVSYKYQFYGEEDGRIEVHAHYALWEQSLPYDITFSAKGLIDIITGASPTGLRDPDDPSKISYADVDDTRYGGVFVLTKKIGSHAVSFEYAHSEEDDYISEGFSLRSRHEFNNANTTLSLGAAYNEDVVQPEFFEKGKDKETLDFSIGLSQVLTPRTVIDASFSLGYSRGYLNDPYKRISRLETIEIPDIPIFTKDVAYAENRPDERLRLAFQLGLIHYFESLRASLDSSYRLFVDDAGLRSHTIQLEWNQKIGDKLVLSPYYRFYHQSEADYYYPNLDNVPFEPNDDQSGRAPFYSSDYRLSALDAHTYGIKLVYFPTDWLTLDVAYERYDMFGHDRVTAAANYPRANVITVGVRAAF